VKLDPGLPWKKQRSTRRRNYKRKGKSDGKTREKTEEATGCSQEIEKILEIERQSNGSHSVENSLWKGQWTCRKTDCRMNEY